MAKKGAALRTFSSLKGAKAMSKRLGKGYYVRKRWFAKSKRIAGKYTVFEKYYD